MKYMRFEKPDGGTAYGLVKEDGIHELAGRPYDSLEESGKVYAPADVRPLAPVEPRVILCVGKNYPDHAVEMSTKLDMADVNFAPGKPIIFGKGLNTLAGPGDAVEYPAGLDRVDYEAELCVVIGKKCKNVSEKDALDYVIGYTCANDLSARDLQWTEQQWTRAKGLDNFCPVGPVVSSEVDPFNARVRSRVNGEPRQDGNSGTMFFNVPFLVSFCSQWLTLLPGDIICTGTPSGVGKILPGDEIEIEIDGIGILKNTIV